MTGIYKIENKINGKIYVGQSVNIKRRWKEHRVRAFSKAVSNHQYECPLYRAIRKYGLDNFCFSVLEECNQEELNKKEKYYIKLYNTLDENFGYNLVDDDYVKTGTQKITSEQLLQIVELLKNSTLTQKEIAQQFNVAESTICQINSGKQLMQDNIIYPIRQNYRNINGQVEKQHYYCQDCETEISTKSSRCKKCSTIYNTNKIYAINNCPSRIELKNLIRIKPFTKIGEMFNVTDNAIRKWCRHYNLPFRKKDIKTYSDEEWEQL